MQSNDRVVAYDGKIAGLYDLEETLGSGHFAVVKLARHVFTGEKVAVKVVDKTKLDEVSRSHLFQEVRCMKLVQHPHVVRLYEVIDTQSKLYLVLELGDGGDLYDYIMKHEGGLSEDMARKYFRQIVRAISYCHQLHVVHRDLKPENVVFFEKLGVVKLTDFGFSNKFCPGQKLETSCGSLAYSAPEILLGDSYDAPAVDVWSLGVILYMLVCGQLPFENANDSETLTLIMDCKYTIPSHISPECKKLITSMLVREPEKRYTLEQISSDPWFTLNAVQDGTEYQPLVSHQQVNEEDHQFVVQKMINGNIATKEDILQALDRNKYNHITATYFLLAERRLRQRRNEEMQNDRSQLANLTSKSSARTNVLHALPNVKVKPVDNAQLIVQEHKDNRSLLVPASAARPARRTRKCSIVQEEDDENEISDSSVQNDLQPAIGRRGSRSEGRINVAVAAKLSESAAAVVDEHKSIRSAYKLGKNSDTTCSARPTQYKDSLSNIACPSKSTSMDRLLDAIDIQSDNDLIDSSESEIFQKMKVKSKNPILTNRRTKIVQIRTSSCSSSEAEDDDNKSKKKKPVILCDPNFRFHGQRRDSNDDSSDSQDQPNYTSSSNRSASNFVCSTTTGNTRSSSNQTQQDCKENGKSSRQHNTKQRKHDHIPRALRCKRTAAADTHQEGRNLESQSLDRICESHENDAIYEKCTTSPRICSSCSKDCIEDRKQFYKAYLKSVKSARKAAAAALHIDSDQMIANRNDEVNNIILDLKVTKAIVSKSRCARAINKISQLKNFFPVVNFS